MAKCVFMCGIPFLYFEGGLENPKKVALSIGYINIICVKWKRRKKVGTFTICLMRLTIYQPQKNTTKKRKQNKESPASLLNCNKEHSWLAAKNRSKATVNQIFGSPNWLPVVCCCLPAGPEKM